MTLQVHKRQKLLMVIGTMSIIVCIYSYTDGMATLLSMQREVKKTLGESTNQSVQPEEVVPDRRHNQTDCTARKPVTAIATWQRVTFEGKKWKQYQLPVVVMNALGRHGNLMGDYATIYAIGKAYNATVGITQELYNKLHPYFPKLSLPVIDVPKDSMEVPDFTNFLYAGMEAAAAGLFGPRVFLAKGTPIECQLFNAYPCDIRREFTFHPDLQERVKAFWWANEKLVNDSIRVGFHIRKTDYEQFVQIFHGTPLPDKAYYFRAMDFYKKKFKKVIFVVATDDQISTKGVFQGHADIIHTPGTNAQEDMAILASCNHSIMTVGTFGFWTAYLAGGYVTYPEGFHIKDYPMQKERYEMSQMDFFVPIPSA